MLVTEINDCRPVKPEKLELRTYKKPKASSTEHNFTDHCTLQYIFKTQNVQSINRCHTYGDARYGYPRPMADTALEHFKTSQCDPNHLKTNHESAQAVCYHNITIPSQIYDDIGTSNEPNLYEELPMATTSNSDKNTSNATVQHPVIPETSFGMLNSSEMKLFNITDELEIINRDLSSSIVRRLVAGKKIYSFWNFAIFTVRSVFKEVENFTFMDVFYLSSALMIIFGVFHGFNCNISFPFVPLCFTMITFGFFGVLSSLANIIYKYLKPKEVTLRYLVWMCRFTMLLFSAVGISELYTYHPPNQEDRDSLSFCPSMMYWTAFYYFHLTAFTFVVIVLTILTILLYYFT